MGTKSNNRLHGMDALRAIAMLLGVVLHASIAYKVHPNLIWPSDNTYHHIAFDITYFFIHIFRMQLFYLVAGFFCRFLYLKIGDKAFLLHRIKRIFIPFLCSLIIIVPISVSPFIYYKIRTQQMLDHNATINYLFDNILTWNGMVHLWFLYYLMMFYISVVFGIRILDKIKIKVICKWLEKLKNFDFTNPFKLIIFTTIPLFLILFLVKSYTIEVYTGFKPQIPHFLYYGLFFCLGWVLHIQKDSFQKMSEKTWYYLIIGFFITIPVFYLIESVNQSTELQTSFNIYLIKFSTTLLTVLFVFGFLGLFIKYFENENYIIRYISDSAYWLYLIHLPIVATLQVYFLYSDIPGELRFWIILFITNLVALLTYQWFIRYTFIGWFLHGPRKRTGAIKNLLLPKFVGK